MRRTIYRSRMMYTRITRPASGNFCTTASESAIPTIRALAHDPTRVPRVPDEAQWAARETSMTRKKTPLGGWALVVATSESTHMCAAVQDPPSGQPHGPKHASPRLGSGYVRPDRGDPHTGPQGSPQLTADTPPNWGPGTYNTEVRANACRRARRASRAAPPTRAHRPPCAAGAPSRARLRQPRSSTHWPLLRGS